MDALLKQRVLGAAVLVALAILLIPMLIQPDDSRLVVEPLPDYEASLPDFTYDSLPAEPITPHVRPRPVDAAAAVPEIRQPAAPWYVQIGTFTESENASSLRDLMHEAGYGATLAADPTQPGRQRVWVGPYPSQKQAETVLDGIRAKTALQFAHDGWVTQAQ